MHALGVGGICSSGQARLLRCCIIRSERPAHGSQALIHCHGPRIHVHLP